MGRKSENGKGREWKVGGTEWKGRGGRTGKGQWCRKEIKLESGGER